MSELFYFTGLLFWIGFALYGIAQLTRHLANDRDRIDVVDTRVSTWRDNHNDLHAKVIDLRNRIDRLETPPSPPGGPAQ